jgi:hypothetical protein
VAGLVHGRDRGPCRRPRCHHPEANHEHLRDGDDCGLCGPLTCPGYRPPLPAWMARLNRALAKPRLP